MSLKEYASKIYKLMEASESVEEVERYFNEAIKYLRNKDFSEDQIEEFKEYLRNQPFKLYESQSNTQTLKNQEKARELLKKKDK